MPETTAARATLAALEEVVLELERVSVILTTLGQLGTGNYAHSEGGPCGQPGCVHVCSMCNVRACVVLSLALTRTARCNQ